MDWLKLSLIVAGIIAGVIIIFVVILIWFAKDLDKSEKLNHEERDKDLYN